MRDQRGSVWRFLLLLFCLAAAAVNTGNNLLYLVFSIMVAVAAVAFVLTGRSLRRLRAELLLPDEVAAGHTFLLGMEARAAEGRFPVGWAEAALEGFPGPTPSLTLPALPPAGRTVVSATVLAERRGIHDGIRVRLATDYPFGLFRRQRRLEAASRLVVTPRRRRIRSLTVDTPVADGSLPHPRLGEGADLFNIRDYTTQDDARRIDWKASARLDRPMLKEFERDQERAFEIVLDERAADSHALTAFEDLVETAASILDHCDEKGIHGRLVVPRPDAAPALLSGRAAMAYLAGVQAWREAPAPSLAGSAPPGVMRIVLSHDPAVRTRIHVEIAQPPPHASPERRDARSGA